MQAGLEFTVRAPERQECLGRSALDEGKYNQTTRLAAAGKFGAAGFSMLLAP
jgi:hypothetical protein